MDPDNTENRRALEECVRVGTFSVLGSCERGLCVKGLFLGGGLCGGRRFGFPLSVRSFFANMHLGMRRGRGLACTCLGRLIKEGHSF